MMTTTSTIKGIFDYQQGDQIQSQTRPITMERVQDYSIGLMSAASGERKPWQFNIHTDHEYARSQGLKAAIADGMLSTNWLSTMMLNHFGADYLYRGGLRTKFIKPTYIDVPLSCTGVVNSRVEQADGSVRYELEVWIEDNEGTKLTVGDASVTVTKSFLS